MSLSCIILAGGSSSRFPSPLPKIFYPFIDKPLIDHLLESVLSFTWNKIVIVTGERSHEGLKLYEESGLVERAYQSQPLGTWNALQTGLEKISTEQCVVINADMPLLDAALLHKVRLSPAPFTLVSTFHPNPYAYGRIIRNKNKVFEAVIEDKHLTDEQQNIREINAGLYKFQVKHLMNQFVECHQEGKEFYLTDLWKEKTDAIKLTEVITYDDHRLLVGVNTWADFELAEQYYFQLKRENLVRQGAMLKNCNSIYPIGKTEVQEGVILEGPLLLQGLVNIGQNSRVHPLSVLKDSILRNQVEVGFYSLLDSVSAASKSSLGPYLKATENTQIGEEAALGSFVEIKRSIVGYKTKAKHLSYVADATIGERCNIGAFVVFCNYDGKNKHSSVLGNEVFIGSSSQIISPIILKDKAYIGAGTTVTCDVDANTLMTRRAAIKMIANWREKRKCVES